MDESRKRNYKIVAAVVAALLLVALIALWFAWHRTEQAADVPAPPGTAFTYEYVKPRNPQLMPTYDLVSKQNVFALMPEIHAVDHAFLLPQTIHFVAAECGESNAFYSQPKTEVVLCYELVDDILSKAKKTAKEQKLDDAFVSDYVYGALRFILLHELGHAMIDQLQLPITGREETAADEFAAVLLLQYLDWGESRGGVESSLHYAGVYLAGGAGKHDVSEFADEHEIGEQRYFNLLCIVYGSDPSGFLDLVTEQGLPRERADTCPAYTKRVMTSWYELLSPHMAKKYQGTRQEWLDQRIKGRQAQDKNVDQYVR